MAAMVYRPDEVQIQGILRGLIRNYRQQRVKAKRR
jgi:hypothetical protein